jgi:1-acyl-sn-glycerol-3-phosphate acyltransferase
VPFMGWFMFHAGYIPLKRGNRESIEECMQRAREYLDMGVSVLFFPEGTRSEDGNVKPFKRGAFKLAIDAQVDVLPFGIAGTKDALPKGTWKYSDDYAYMKVNVGHPISTKGMTEKDIERLMEMSRDAVIALKEELEGQDPKSTRQEQYRKAS